MSYHRDYHQFDFDDHHLDMMYPPTDLDLEIARTYGKCLQKVEETPDTLPNERTTEDD
tara:strand:- start:242 stop:415 length:174 start_codon:yes stop_codon:yes gene_type:complete